MKNIYFLFICCTVLWLNSGCDDNQEKMFDGETSLHFNLTNQQLDSMVYSFINTSDNFITINLPVELAGYANHNTTFRLKVNSAQTTAVEGKHYRSLEQQYTIEPGIYQTTIPLTVLYSGELDSISVRLALEIEPLEGLTTGIPHRRQVTIITNNQLQPIPSNYWTRFYNPYFGPYSKVKHRYILSELKLNTFINFEDYLEWFNVAKNEKDAYGRYMNNYFAEHAIVDENEQPIDPWIK